MNIKELRYKIMLALYLPILLYSFSTFDIDEASVVFEDPKPMIVPSTMNVFEGDGPEAVNVQPANAASAPVDSARVAN